MCRGGQLGRPDSSLALPLEQAGQAACRQLPICVGATAASTASEQNLAQQRTSALPTPRAAPLPSQVLGQVARFSAAVGGATRVLLVPSTRDVLSAPVLPQAPLAAPGAAQPGASLPLANPSTLRLNEVVLGCTSADWLMACSREEAAKAAPGEERLPALAAQLAAQRCYFPLFPPPLDSPVDCARGAAALAMPASPDLLVLPSDLAPFAKTCPVHTPADAAAAADAAQADAAAGEAGGAPAPAAAPQQPPANAVCVNPGRLTKGASGEEARFSGLPMRAHSGWEQLGPHAGLPNSRPSAPAASLQALPATLVLVALPVHRAQAATHLTVGCPPLAPQAAPLRTSTSSHCPRRWPWRVVRRQPPTPRCPTSWTGGAGWTSGASEPARLSARCTALRAPGLRPTALISPLLLLLRWHHFALALLARIATPTDETDGTRVGEGEGGEAPWHLREKACPGRSLGEGAKMFERVKHTKITGQSHMSGQQQACQA